MMHDFTKGNCLDCKLSVLDYFDIPFLRGTHCPGVFSCCGGKSPGARWDSHSMRWVCKDCGTPAKKDDDILEYRPLYATPTHTKKSSCECGSSALGSDRHSGYCPLYVKP